MPCSTCLLLHDGALSTVARHAHNDSTDASDFGHQYHALVDEDAHLIQHGNGQFKEAQHIRTWRQHVGKVCQLSLVFRRQGTNLIMVETKSGRIQFAAVVLYGREVVLFLRLLKTHCGCGNGTVTRLNGGVQSVDHALLNHGTGGSVLRRQAIKDLLGCGPQANGNAASRQAQLLIQTQPIFLVLIVFQALLHEKEENRQMARRLIFKRRLSACDRAANGNSAFLTSDLGAASAPAGWSRFARPAAHF